MNAPSEQPLVVKVSEDHMQVTVNCSIPPGDLTGLKDSIIKKLQDMHVREEAFAVDLETLLRDAAPDDGSPVQGLVIYEGDRAVPPQNGYVEWTRDYFKEGFIIDEDTGAIDFRKIAAELSVHEGELLATLVPPTEGVPGKDVFGKRIKPGRGKPAKLRAGQGVKQLEPHTFYAATSGRIRWNGKFLSIDNVFTVTGDVGLKTGHIEHPGALVVQGDITEGSEVTADGDIEVHGIIEAATVTAGGDLIVHGGIVGGDGTKIRAGGGVQARYIMEADIEATNDVIVEKEIVHSRVVSRGNILLPRGRIVGGESYALREIQTGDTGSEAGVRTTFVLGEDPLKEEALRRPRIDIESMRADKEKILDAVAPFETKKNKLSAERREILEALLRRLDMIEVDIDELAKFIESTETERITPDELKVVINGQIYSDTAFNMRKETFIVPRPVQGPIKAVFRKGKIKLIGLR